MVFLINFSLFSRHFSDKSSTNSEITRISRHFRSKSSTNCEITRIFQILSNNSSTNSEITRSTFGTTLAASSYVSFSSVAVERHTTKLLQLADNLTVIEIKKRFMTIVIGC